MEKNNICLYWSPGSYGDIIQCLIASTGYNSTAADPTIDSNGKINFSSEKDFNLYSNDKTRIMYTHQSWTQVELKALDKFSPFIVCTHVIDQVNVIKDFFGNRITTIGITYNNKSDYEKILRSWIKKVGKFDTKLEVYFGKDEKHLIDKFKEKNLYEEYLFKKFTKYSFKYTPLQVENIFDINLPFDLIDNKNINSISKILNINFSDETKDFFNIWAKNQEKISTVDFTLNSTKE